MGTFLQLSSLNTNLSSISKIKIVFGANTSISGAISGAVGCPPVLPVVSRGDPMYSYERNIKLGAMKALPITVVGDNSEERVGQALHGGKIILPNSVLQRVFRADRSLLIFKLINEEKKLNVFCGVLTFDGDDRTARLPLWMFKQLDMNFEDQVTVECVTSAIQKGMFVKFQPMTESFVQISDPKTVLEHCLRAYVCLSNEDVISIYYNRNVYELRVCQTLPSDTIIINECDLTVDFEEMKTSPQEVKLPPECDLDHIQAQLANKSNTHIQTFAGVGRSTSGRRPEIETKERKGSTSSLDRPNEGRKEELNSKKASTKPIGMPDYGYQLGQIFFKRHRKDLIPSEQKEESQQKERKDRKRNVRDRRPVTRSQTQPYRTAMNGSSMRNKTRNGKDSAIGSDRSQKSDSSDSSDESDTKKRKRQQK